VAANPNALFGFPNLADVLPANGVFSGRMPVFLDNIGQWLPGAPLTNLQDRFFANKARSPNASTLNSQFAIDLTGTFPVLAVTIPKHNLTLAAVLIVTLWADMAMTVMVAQKEVQVVTQAAWGSLSFGSDSWLDGRISAETAQYFQQPATAIFDAPQLCRVVQIQIADPGNPDQYIELSRLFITPGYQPSINIKYGAQIGADDPTIDTPSLAGADYYDQRPKHRIAIGGIDYLPEGEAFANWMMMQLRLGISGQFFFSMYPADPTKSALTSFVATFQKLDPLTAISFGYQGVAFAIKEVVA
jgi:hypothetical protein